MASPPGARSAPDPTTTLALARHTRRTERHGELEHDRRMQAARAFALSPAARAALEPATVSLIEEIPAKVLQSAVTPQ